MTLFLALSFLSVEWGEQPPPYDLQSTKTGTADSRTGEKTVSIMGRSGGYILQLSRKMWQSSDIEVLGPMRINSNLQRADKG